MNLLLSAASAAAIAATAPVAPAAPASPGARYERWGEWQVGSAGRHACAAIREFPGGARLFIVVDRDGTGMLHLTDPRWSMKQGEAYRVTLALDGRRHAVEWKGTRDGAGVGLLGPLDARFVNDLATTRSLELFRPDGDRLAHLDLAGAPAAIYRARGCASESLAGSGPPIAAPPPPPALPLRPPLPNQRPRPRSSYGLVVDADYPASAIRAGEQGTVVFTLSVNETGRVTACTVTQSSGSAALDAAACRLMTSRARFHPATDAKGNATTDTVTSRIVWRLPEPEPPAPPPPPSR